MEVQFWTGGDLGRNGLYNCSGGKVSNWKKHYSDITAYHTLTYDSTDVFEMDAAGADVTTSVMGASEAQFEAAMAALTGLTTNISGTEREAATGSQISVWVLGR